MAEETFARIENMVVALLPPLSVLLVIRSAVPLWCLLRSSRVPPVVVKTNDMNLA